MQQINTSMKKFFLITSFTLFCLFSQAEGNCNSDFLKELPADLKTLIDKASANSTDNIAVSMELLEKAKIWVKNSSGYTETQKYDFLQKIEKTAGVIYEENNQLDKAKAHYVEELTLVELSQNLEAKMGVYIDLAIVEKRKGNFKEAKENYTKCLVLAEKENNNKLQDFAHYGLGTLYEASGDYELAVQSYISSLKLAEARGSLSDAINTMQNLAITYTKLGNNALALETIDKAYRQTANIKDTILVASIIFDYGKVYNTAGNHDAALEKFLQSLEIFKAQNFKPLIARSLFYIADTYTLKGDYAKSQSYFVECEKYKKYISKRSSAELHNKLGNLYLQKSDLSKAKAMFQESFELSNQCDYKDLKRESSYQLANIYEKLGDYKEAHRFLTIASITKDSIYNEAHTKGITELQLKYDTEKSQNEINNLKYRQGQLWLVFGGISALLVLIGAFYFIRLTNQNNKSLQLKNRQIEEQNKILTEQNEALEQFAYAAAHDLKEPLRNIGSFVNLLQRRYKDQFDDNAKEYMGFITNGVKRMNDLLVGLLNLSSLTSERANNEEVVMEHVVEVVKSNLKMAIEEKNAEVTCDGKLIKIPMNQLHLIQLLQNLVGNALKFVENRPSVQINARETDSNIEISVKDNGIGMDKAYENKVFRLFQRLEKNKDYEGNGVGLSICKNIVEKYGGKIWYESELNHGTQFFINIPKQKALNAA
jgi:signal transduction histidine kinase